MKIPLIHTTLLLLLLVSSCSGLKTTPEIIAEITRKVESKNFTVVVNYANPMRMNPIFLTSEYDLRIKNDSAFAYLPYYGVAHVAPYDSNESGIKFAEPMTDYTINRNKKSTGWDIRFRVKSKISAYDVIMNVYNNGSSTITVSSYERDMITFNGEIKR